MTLSTQLYKYGYQKLTAGDPAMDYHPIQGGVEILLVASCYRNRDRMQTNLFVEQFVDFMFHWIKQLHLSSREPNQQLQAVR